MSDKRGGGLTIHPTVMQCMGPEWVKAAINVRDWLHDGTVKPKSAMVLWYPWSSAWDDHFDMANSCCCIGHHIGKQLDAKGWKEAIEAGKGCRLTPFARANFAYYHRAAAEEDIRSALCGLFASDNPNDPVKAANAIEEFLVAARVTRPWP